MLNKDEQIELANKQILANASAELLEYSKFLNGGALPNDARLLGKNAGRMILKSLNAGASKQEIIDMLLKAGISGRNSTAAKALLQTRDINAYNAQMRGGEAELIAELSQNVRVATKNESIGAILGSAKEKAIKNDELLKKGVGNQGLDDVINTFKSSKSGKEFEVAENGFGRELLSYDGVAANEEMKRSFLAWEAQEKKADITLHDGRKVVFLEPDEAVQLSYGNSYLYGEKDLEALFARRRAESLEQKLKRLQSHPAYENLLKMRENTKASELKGDTVGGSKPTVFYEPQSERYLRTQGGGGLPNAERSITITKADVAKLRADKANEALATKLENNLEALTGDPAASGLIDDLLTRDYHLASAAKKSELVAPKNADEVAKSAGMKAGFSTAEMPSAMLGGAAGHMAGSAIGAGAGEYESEGGVAGAIIGALAGLASPKAAAKIAAKMIAKKASKIELMPNMPFKEAQDKVQKDLMKYVGVDIKNADSGIVAQINNNGAKKIVSNDAIQKSRNNKFSAGEHLSVAQKTPELFKDATFIGRYDDIKNSQSSVKILRFAKNIEVKGKNAVAIITAKESVDKDLKRIYSMELEELRKAELKFGNYDKTQTPASKPLISQDNGVVNSVAPIKDGANSTPKEIKSQGGGGLKRGFSTQALNELMLGLGGGGANAMAEDDPNKKAEAFIKGFLAGFGGAKAASMLAKNAPKLAPQLARASEKMASDFPRLLNDRPDILGGVLGRMNNAKDKFSFIFGGEKALGANKAKLKVAKTMWASDEEIWAKTGWYKDIDGKWKFEINAEGGKLKKEFVDENDEIGDFFEKEIKTQKDLKAMEKYGEVDYEKFKENAKYYRKDYTLKVKDLLLNGSLKNDKLYREYMNNPLGEVKSKYKFRSGFLADILDDKPLFKAYPMLKDIRVRALNSNNGANAEYRYNRASDVLGDIYVDFNLAPHAFKSSLYHEIQHAVQHIEEFSNGGSPKQWGYEKYEKLAGEAEARNVQARLGTNGKEYPLKTMDIDPNERIVTDLYGYEIASYTPKQKEMRGIHNVTFNDKKATYIKTDLENIDSAIRYANSSRDKGAKHIKIRHLTDKTKSGYITNEELMNLGNSLREYIKINKEPFIDSNGARIYEWENKEGVRFRVVADSSRRDATTAELPQPRATDDIITFYSDRNLNEPMNFKNPNLNSAISNIKSQELSMRESFSPELKASYDMRDKLLKSTNEVRASLSKKGKAELEKLAGSKDSKLSRDAQIMKTLENAKSNPARYERLKKLYLDENGKVKDSIGLC